MKNFSLKYLFFFQQISFKMNNGDFFQHFSGCTQVIKFNFYL